MISPVRDQWRSVLSARASVVVEAIGGPYYHGSWRKLPVGTVIEASGAGGLASPNWDYDEGYLSKDRADWVWMTESIQEAAVWGVRPTIVPRPTNPEALDGGYVYEVRPLGGVRQWHERERAFVTDRAVVMRELTPEEIKADVDRMAEDWSRAAAKQATYWRLHPARRTFGPEDASSTPFIPIPGEVGTQSGYSCFADPWHLWLYVNQQFANPGVGDVVIAFTGHHVGTGMDGEDLAIPDMGTVRRMTWDEFETTLRTMPIPPTPQHGTFRGFHNRSWRDYLDHWQGSTPVLDYLRSKVAAKSPEGRWVPENDRQARALDKLRAIPTAGTKTVDGEVINDAVSVQAAGAVRYEDVNADLAAAAEGAERLPTTRIPVSSIIATKPYLKRDSVAAALHGLDDSASPFFRPGYLPVVVRRNGKHYLYDGHHRLGAALMLGHLTIEVHLVDEAKTAAASELVLYHGTTNTIARQIEYAGIRDQSDDARRDPALAQVDGFRSFEHAVAWTRGVYDGCAVVEYRAYPDQVTMEAPTQVRTGNIPASQIIRVHYDADSDTRTAACDVWEVTKQAGVYTIAAAGPRSFYAPEKGGKYHAANPVSFTAACGKPLILDRGQVITVQPGEKPHPIICSRCWNLASEAAIKDACSGYTSSVTKTAVNVTVTERPASAGEKITAMQQGFNASRSVMWEATVGGEDVAQLWLSPGSAEYPMMGATIHALYVDPEWRRQGVATQLLDRMADRYAGDPVDPGGMTPEGEQLWNRWVNANGFYEVNGIWWLEEEPDFDD